MEKLPHENYQLEDLPNEKWIDCIGFDGVYAVSNLGRIKSLERWRQTRPGVGYMMKEKIRKQNVSDSSIRVFLCSEGKAKPFITSRLVFFSFNYNVQNLPEYFVMHKNNDWKDNRLENLKIGTQNEISKLTFEKGKMEHLKDGNPVLSEHNRNTAIFENGILTKKKCTMCDTYKSVSKFRKDRNECKECSYYGRKGIKRKHGFKIQVTDLKTKEVTIYKNFNDPEFLKIMSISTAMKYAESGEIYRPYRNSKNKNVNPILIRRLNEV